jgi:hypothetical protein
MFQNKKFIQIGLALIAVAIVTVIGFQNCGSSMTPYNSSLTSTSASTAVASCGGTYTAIAGGNSGTLTIVEDGSGNITGTLNVKGVNGNISGTCTNTNGVNSINFTRTIQPEYQIYAGTLTATSGGLTSWTMSGTYYTCTTSCDSGTNTWSAN